MTRSRSTVGGTEPCSNWMMHLSGFVCGSSSCVEGCGAAVLALDAADLWPAAEEADRCA
jgi:hypothetical protein